MNRKSILRPQDVATELGVTSGRVYQLIQAGRIPAVRMGRSIRIPREAWERWLHAQSDRALESVEVAEGVEDGDKGVES